MPDPLKLIEAEHAERASLQPELLARLSGRWDRRVVPLVVEEGTVMVAVDESRRLSAGEIDALAEEFGMRVHELEATSQAFEILLSKTAVREEVSPLLDRILRQALQSRATDVFVSAGRVPMVSVDGAVTELPNWTRALHAREVEAITSKLLGQSRWDELDGDMDLAVEVVGRRFRLNVAMTVNGFSLSFRPIAEEIPAFESLGIPHAILDFVRQPRGLVIISGPTGSGKSTTLAATLDFLARRQHYKIVTLEDPIEYVFRDSTSIFDQRSVGPLRQGNHCVSFSRGLRAAMRQRPDVIMVGEMRDQETFSAALEAAETGHLVIATLHTDSAIEAFHRIASYYEGREKEVATKLAQALVGVCVQRIFPKAQDKGLVVACEVLVNTSPVRTQISEGHYESLANLIETGQKDGQQSLDLSLAKLVIEKIIDEQTAMTAVTDNTAYRRHLETLRGRASEGSTGARL